MDHNPEYDVKIAEAIQAADQSKEENEVTLESGVILKLKKINIMRIQTIVDRFQYPDPPKKMNEAKGRVEENPNDPKYIQECQLVDVHRTLAVLDAIAAFGTEIKYVPDNVTKLEDETWVEELALIDIEVPETGPGRYLFWIKFVAIVETSDMQKIADQFTMQMGISEKEINEHLSSSFPDQPQQ